jgi:hypothetical protein
MGVLALLPCVPDGAARRLAWPLRVLGGNAILAFGISQVLGAISGLPLLPGGKSPQGWGFSVASAIVPDAHLASLACAVAVLALITLVIVPLHRRGVHIRL